MNRDVPSGVLRGGDAPDVRAGAQAPLAAISPGLAGAAAAGPVAAQAGERGRRFNFAFAVVFAAVLWLVAAPAVMLVYSSFTAEAGKLPFEATGISLANYIKMLTNPQSYKLLWVTAVFTIGATSIGIGITILFAWLIERTDLWLRKFFFVAILIPMAIPNMIYAMAWIQLLGPNNGLINTTLDMLGLGFLRVDVFSLGCMIMIQGIVLASHGYLLIAVCFRTLDASWEEQSYIAGQRLWGTVLRVTLPMLKPALLAAALFFAVVAMETFDIPVTLGLTSRVHVVSTQIYWSTRPETGQLPDYGMASALSILLVLIALALIHLYQRQTRHAKSFVTVTGRGYRQHRIALGRWQVPLFLFACTFVFFAVVLPLFMLVWRSLLRFYMYPSLQALGRLNLESYRAMLADPDAPMVLRNTTIVAVVAGLAILVVAAAVAWQVVRGSASPPWRRSLSSVVFASQSFPGIVIGLTLIYLYLWLPIPIYGTIWILVIAMVTKYLAYSTGTMIAAQLQISGELEEASRISGAGGWSTYWNIVLPLLMPALGACFLWVVIHVVRELGLALMLYSLQSQVLSTKIWLLWENGRVADACATGVLTVIALLILLSISTVWGWGAQFVARVRTVGGAAMAVPATVRGTA